MGSLYAALTAFHLPDLQSHDMILNEVLRTFLLAYRHLNNTLQQLRLQSWVFTNSGARQNILLHDLHYRARNLQPSFRDCIHNRRTFSGPAVGTPEEE